MKAKKIKKIIFIALILLFSFSAQNSFADHLGESRDFYVNSGYDYDQRVQVSASLRYISQKAYFYVEDRWWYSLSTYERSQAQKKIEELGKEFSNVIYPKMTDFFGHPWEPGIDNDYRITVLMTSIKKGVGGYFDSCQEYPKNLCSHSNAREMIYLNASLVFDKNVKGYLAHEFQHLINWNQKENIAGKREDVWLNEMRSEYVASLLNYNDKYSGSILEMRVKNFLADPSNPLCEWKESASDAGIVTIFGQYLANQFGQNIFSLMIKNPLIGIQSVNQALKDAGYSEKFDDAFTYWSLANYYNNLSIGIGGKFGYTNPNLKKIHINPTKNNFYKYGIATFSNWVKDWSPRWYLIGNKLEEKKSSVALKIEFKSSNPKSDFRIPYMINYENGEHELHFITLNNSQEGDAYVFNFAKNVKSVLIVPANHSKRANFTNNDPATYFTLKTSTVFVNQPAISKIIPERGSLVGGNQVVVEGGNFQPGVEIYFGGIRAQKVIFVNENKLKVIVPSHQKGIVNVWIKNPNGENSVYASGYEYTSEIIPDGSLIRARGDYKVYVVNGRYKRHILDKRIFDFYGHMSWDKVIEVSPEKCASYKESFWVRALNDTKVYEVNNDKTKHWLNMTAENFTASGRSWEGVFVINKNERNFYKTGADVLYR